MAQVPSSRLNGSETFCFQAVILPSFCHMLNQSQYPSHPVRVHMKLPLLSASLVALSAPAFAATISVSTFSPGAYAAATAGTTVTETFEGYSEMNVDNSFATAVGTFSTLGGTGTGSTVTGADFANDGSRLALRDGNVFGRTSSTSVLSGNAGDDMFLDSNDTWGITWNVALAGGGMFDRIVFTLTDASDVGATLHVVADGLTQTISGLANGARRLVQIDFGSGVSSASIVLANFRNGSYTLNDGFSIDDISVSAVPLPASALLLLGGLGGIAALGRRRKV